MYKNSILKAIVSALLLAPVMAKAQGTIDDYKRAYSLYNKFNATHVYGNAENIKWEGNGIFHYTVRPDTPRSAAHRLDNRRIS